MVGRALSCPVLAPGAELSLLCLSRLVNYLAESVCCAEYISLSTCTLVAVCDRSNMRSSLLSCRNARSIVGACILFPSHMRSSSLCLVAMQGGL